MQSAERLHAARERLTAANEHARMCAFYLSRANDPTEAGMRMQAVIKANEALQAAAVEYNDALTQHESA